MNPRALRILTISASTASEVALFGGTRARRSCATFAEPALLATFGESADPVTETGGPPDTRRPVDTGPPMKPTDDRPATTTMHRVEAENIAEEDLSDHWHDAGPMGTELDLSTVWRSTPGDGLAKVGSGLGAASAALAGDWRRAHATRRVHVAPTHGDEDVAKPEEGPAGHFDIRLDLSEPPGTSPSQRNRVLLERTTNYRGRRIEGAFHGPGHEEMADTCNDRDTRVLAAFGVARNAAASR